MNAKISIIIPAYNIAKELPSCLDSILAQTYSNIEVIVVNDGSKDETASVIDQYAKKDPRIKAIHKENGGVTSARLRGVREASGDWVGFVDGDDIIEPYMYQRLLQNAKTHNADISHCGYRMVFPSRVDFYYNTGKLTIQNTETGLADLISGTFVEPALWNKLYKKDLLDSLIAHDFMDPSIRNFEDLLMNFYLFRASKTSVFEDICPYHYMLRAGSAATSRLNEHKVMDPVRVSKIMVQECQDSPLLQSLTHVRLFRQLINLATIPLQENKDWLKPHRDSARKELRALLSTMKNSPACSKSLYLQGCWAAFSPLTYQWIHSLHGAITGNNKKYEVK